MNASIPVTRGRRKALTLSVLVGAFLTALLGLAADPAQAAYTARVQAGTLRITGNSASDKLVLRLQPGSPTTLQVDVGADGTADFSFDRNTFTAIAVNAGQGDDEVRIDQSGGAFVDEVVTINGGSGDDTLLGGSGAETFLGGGGEDLVDGNQGADRALLGGGDDRFQWDPGDGSDTVEGQGGDDRLDFNGSNIGEQIDVSANGPRIRFTRNIANIVMDLDELERVDFHAFGGADIVVVNDLTGTDVELVDADLNAPAGGGGDGQPDSVTVRGTEGADRVSLSSPGGYPTVSGLHAQVLVESAEATLDEINVAALGGEDTISTGREVHGPASYNVDGGDGADVTRYSGTAVDDPIDVVANGAEVSTIAPLAARLDTIAVESLVVLGLAGEDTTSATGNLAALTTLTIDGGEDNDTLRGGNGADLLIGGNGDDSVDGNQGVDRALLGAGDDRFQWDPGDGNDTIEGQAGDDRLDFNGSNIGEQIDVSANGPRIRFTRNIANIVMDLDDVERIGFNALGGADTIVANDLAGTDAKSVEVDLNLSGGGDAQADTVIARGTPGADSVSIGSLAGTLVVFGPAAQVQVSGSEDANDNLNVETLGGADTITTGVGVSGPAPINVDGGDDSDIVRYSGTAAADTIDVVANGAEVSTIAPLAARLDTIAVESLVVLGLAGEDTTSATGNLAALTTLTIDGGEDNDTLRGGNGADLLIGGNGDDSVDGNQGVDRALLGAGDDRFQWDPGDGNDTVEGQAGDDRLDFNGSNIGEQIDVSANGPRIRFTRNIANIVMDLDGVERIGFRAFGGADTIVVNDLAGTDAKTVEMDLQAVGGGGDAQPDSIVVNGTNRRDVVQVTRSGVQVVASGLTAQILIVGSEAAGDTLLVQTLDGNDDVTVAPDVSDLIATTVDLGAGE